MSGKADELIGDLTAEQKARHYSVVIDGDAREFLEKILTHNDESPRPLRVSLDRVIAVLADEYGIDVSQSGLNAWMRRELGRKSWGRK